MKLNVYKRLWGLLPVVVLLLSTLVACTGSEEDVIKVGKGDTLIAFSLRLPGTSDPTSRALTESDENIVKEIDVLVFKPGGEYVYTAGCSGSDITGTGNKKTFTVKLRQGTFDLVILANARDILAGATLTGKNKDAALAELTAALPADGKWLANASQANFRPFSMWGNTGTISINDQTDLTGDNAIPLLRMIARVDVVVPSTVTNFILTSVHVYNYNTEGTVVPGTASGWTVASGKVTYPTVPTTSTLTEGPILYANTEINTAGNQCMREIYLMESENHTDNHTKPKESLKRTCLVVGGTYENDSKPTYYRVDFSSGSGASLKYMDLLRNHKYTINITKVSGPGYENEDIAYRSAPINIEAGIVEWNEGGMGNNVFDGQHVLSVSQDLFTFSREAKTVEEADNVLYVKTDYIMEGKPELSGWHVEKIVDAEDGTSATWVRLSPNKGVANDKTKVILEVDKNNGPKNRSAKIWIAAGRLRLPVIVEQTQQSGTGALGVTITNGDGEAVTELVFLSSIGQSPASQVLNVNWQPKDVGLSVTNTPVGPNAFPSGVGGPTTGMLSANLNGTYSYNIAPAAMTSAESGDEKVSKVEFVVSSGGKSATGSVMLRQLVPYLEVDGERWYKSDGRNYAFRVRSNTKWKILSITETDNLLNVQPSDNLREGTTGGPNTILGNEIKFTTQNSTSSSTVTVVFRYTYSSTFDDVTYKFEIGGAYHPVPSTRFAGSNIYWDGEKLTFDDEGVTTNQKWQGVYFQWGSLWGISPVGAFNTATIVYELINGKHEATTNHSWTSLPYVTTGTDSDRTRAYLYEVTDEADSNIGDICRYLTIKGDAPEGKSWRMPTSKEMDYLKVPRDGLIAQTSTAIDGKFSIVGGISKDDVRLPASGYRHHTSQVFRVGEYGYYWSSSSNGSNAYSLWFQSTASNPFSTDPRKFGSSVRCVVDN